MPAVQCKYAKSLGGGFDGTPASAWGTIDYTNRHKPTVFVGMYDLRDYVALWRHRGKAWVWWAGSDIRNMRSNFIFNDGKLLWLSQLFSNWGTSFRDWLIKKVLIKAEHWCENEAEAWQLKDCGIKVAGVCPSFLGDIKKYKVSFKPGNKVYLSANLGREEEYGWGLIWNIAPFLPEIEFHLFGSPWLDKLVSIKAQNCELKQIRPNIIIHGRISGKKMRQLIMGMQCGLRLNKHDGFSEITAKSVLWGQYPITYLYNKDIDQLAADDYGIMDTDSNIRRLVKLLRQIPKKTKPNLKARDWYIKNLNKYPWNAKFSH